MKFTATAIVSVLLLLVSVAVAEDWPMGGRTRDRNPVSSEKNAPVDWQVKTEKLEPSNIRWSAPLSGHAIGGPVVAGGLIWVGAANYLKPFDPKITDDRGVLACFRESDGKFLYQYTAPRLGKASQDWSNNGLSGSPLVEGDRLWFITNRREIVCLDIAALRRGDGTAKELWKYDLIAEHKIVPASPMMHWHNTLGSLATYKDLLFVPTGNGVSVDNPYAKKIKAPEAPSIVCLNKDKGTLVWKDNSAGGMGYGGHHASPLVVEMSGKVQVIHPQADGWVRSYAAESGKILWQFDTNFKDGKWDGGSKEHSNSVVTATPVFADGKVYFARGRENEFQGKYGRMFCVDPTKHGDVSPQLDDGKGAVKANPNSALLWEFMVDGDESERLYETNSAVAVADGLVILPDSAGLVHCFDAASGRRYWVHDVFDSVRSDPLIVDGKIYIGDAGGNVSIFKLSKKEELLATRDTHQEIAAPPVFANGTLFIQTTSILYAIKKP